MKRQEEGITLIALIITIIILIILTAITISNVMGSNLFGLARGAVENYVDAGKEEENAINELISAAGEIGKGDTKEPISKEEPFVGYYADIEDDGTVDGIIYADLAIGNTKSGTWGSGYFISTYNIEPTEDKSTLEEYYVKEENYDGPFGPAKVIAPISRDTNIENDRFYVIALEDLNNGTYYCWYSAAPGKMTDYAETTKEGFGEGRRNTTNMMAKWNDPELPYGKHDQSSYCLDMWGQIGDLVDKGWFVPSKDEWAAFGGELEITNSSETDGYYANKGLSEEIWASSQRDADCAEYIDFAYNHMDNHELNESVVAVRLSTTF